MKRLASLLLALLPALAACGDVKTNLSNSSAAVPAALVGEWTGTWTADGGGNAGTLTLRVQDFAGQPVVQIDTDMPCIAGTTFELLFAATSFTARVGGQQVLDGALTAPSQLAGTFTCAAGQGTWQATRQRVLPLVTDLSGAWSGALYLQGTTPQPFLLDLSMTLDSGVLRLDGVLDVQGEPTATIVGYGLDFDDDGYQVFFETTDGRLRAQGTGLYGPLRIENGQWGAFAGNTPIGGGVFAMERQAP